MEKLLISACLFGQSVTYKGTNHAINKEELEKFFELIPVCPEVMGGLPIPRLPSERMGDSVYHQNGKDVTENYQKGAEIALQLCQKHTIHYALLKAKSPSCGKMCYDGTFSHHLIDRPGVTVELLSNHGIEVFDETEIEKLLEIARK